MKTTIIFPVILLLTVASCSRPAVETKEEVAVVEPQSESKPIEMSAEAQKHIDLQVVTASKRNLNEYLQAIGTIKPIDARVAHIRALTSGRLASVTVKLGDRVTANQVLATYENLEAGEVVSQHQTARAELEKLNVQLAVAKQQTERNRQLADIGAIPRKEYELSQGEERSITASIAVQQSVVNGFTAKLGRLGLGTDSASTSSTTAIRSSFGGIVVATSAAPGETITPESELFAIADLSQVWVQAEVYEKDLGRIQLGRTASIKVDTYPDREFSGPVTYISDLLDPQTRTAKIRCEVTNADGRLKVDMFASVLLPTTFSKQALAIPADAIQQIEGKSVVFVRKGATTFEQRAVQVGRTVQGIAEIASGLQDGESVVTKGAFHLKSIVLGDQIGEEE
jgi:cobalt-zinc-cadmium efflux system membrane fusion protein